MVGGGGGGGGFLYVLSLTQSTIVLDAYSLENWHGVERYFFNAIVSPQDFQDTYFPAFEVWYPWIHTCIHA